MKGLHAIVFCLATVGLVGPATACMNDAETPTHEREFRSQYSGFPQVASKDQPVYRHPIGRNVLIGGGAFMLIGAFALVSRRSR